MMHWFLRMSIFFYSSFLVLQYLKPVDSCNEAVCASIVSKCMITQACKCDLENCTCCKDCFNCLSNLYTECCSCLDMCPKPNNTVKSALSKQSHVEELPEPIPTLFQSLVSEPDSLDRWFTLTFPIDFPNLEMKKTTVGITNEQEVDPVRDNIITLNCSVAYMSQCMPWTKCKASCQSMGAQSYRWFHDGCCECVGDKCINYGIAESRCTQCPSPQVVQPDNAQLDFGEDDDSTT